MPGVYDHEEIPLPLVRRIEPRDVDSEDSGSRGVDVSATSRPVLMDRMGPGVSGGLAGFFAGAAALGVAHGLAPSALVGPVAAAARHWSVTPEISLAVAYATAGAVGSLVGACFARVTRYLRRWIPLVIWALVFFLSLTLLLLALSGAYGRGAGVPFAPAILAASAAYALLVSFSLPLRKRG